MKFYQLSPEERRNLLAEEGIRLDEIDQSVLKQLDKLSENVVGQMRLPLGIVQNLVVNGKKYTVPLVTEEPSVVAAANHGAQIFAMNHGVTAESKRNGIFGQVVFRIESNFELDKLKASFPKVIDETNNEFASLVKHGGGLKKISAHLKKELLYLKVLVDPAEAMGANKTNSILEYLGNRLSTFPGIREKLFAILSNYPSQLTTAKAVIDVASIGGIDVAKRISLLSQIAHDDVYRAVTNNKGIMNGVDAVLIATGNDYRAVEAASAVLASQSGQYRSLSNWSIEEGKLVGELTLPLAIGTVGGSINARRDVQQAYRILGGNIKAHTLAEIIASVGLANNLAAILAISTTGIQAGHMKLQARNIVANLDASDEEKQRVLMRMIAEKNYTIEEANKILRKLSEEK